MSDELQFHQARWNEPIVFELGSPGERAYLPPPVEASVAALAGPAAALVPESARRRQAPALPEIAQPRLRKHFLRLSQETMGAADRRRHRPGHRDDEVQPAGARSHRASAAQPAPAGTRRERARSARDRRALRGHPARALGPRPLQLPARWRDARHLRQRMHRARLARPPRASAARRDHHDPALAPRGRRRARDGRLPHRHPPAGPERLPDARRPARRRQRPHGRALHCQSGGHRTLQRRNRRARHDRSRGRGPVRIRPGQRERHAHDRASSRRGLRHVPVQPAQDVRLAARLRWPGLRCDRCSRRAGAVSPRAHDRARERRQPLPRPRSAPQCRPRTRVLRRDRHGCARLRVGRQPRPRGATAGGRDRRAQQQLPRNAARRDRGHRRELQSRRALSPPRADPLLAGRRPRPLRPRHGGDLATDRGSRRGRLLPEPPPLDGQRADDAGAHRVRVARRSSTTMSSCCRMCWPRPRATPHVSKPRPSGRPSIASTRARSTIRSGGR